MNNGGIGITGLLTLAFFIAKITNYIDWSWWWVFSPLWISGSIGIILVLLVSFAKGVKYE